MKRSVLAVAAIALSASVAQAQTAVTTRPYTFGVSAGVSIPSGDLSSKDQDAETIGGAQTGFNVNGILGYESPSLPFGIRAELMYNRFGVDKDYLGGADADYSVLGGNVNAVFNLGTGMAARPYVIAGVGYSQLKVTVDAGGADVSSSKSGVGFNGGLGLRFPLGAMSTFVEARYHYIMTEDKNADIPVSNTQFIPISFGVMF